MKIIITDIGSGEEEILTLKAPRKEQYLGDDIVRRQREFAIDAVILESLKFIANRDASPRFIASPNSRQHSTPGEQEHSLSELNPRMIISLEHWAEACLNAGERLTALFNPHHLSIEETTDVWSSTNTNPASDLMRLRDNYEFFNSEE